jgi:hypothetical protein
MNDKKKKEVTIEDVIECGDWMQGCVADQDDPDPDGDLAYYGMLD